MSLNETRAKLELLAPGIARAVTDDREFFEKNPKRRYRLRRAVPEEIEHLRIRNPFWKVVLPRNWVWFAAVYQSEPGVRSRVHGAMAPGGWHGASEVISQAFYSAWIAESSVRAFESRLSSNTFGVLRK